MLQSAWNPSKTLHNTPEPADAFELAELDYEIRLQTNNYLVEWECVRQLLGTVNTRRRRETFRGGLVDDVRVNGGQNYKRALCPHSNWSWKSKVVEGGGGFCLETPFTPGNWILPAEVIPVAGASGLAAGTGRGEHGERLYFEVYLLPTCLKTSHETLATNSEIVAVSRKTCQCLKIFVPWFDQLLPSVSRAGFDISVVQQ